MRIDAEKIHYKELNETIYRTQETDIIIDNASGHRYVGAGVKGKNITINGIPGNALGAYLDGSTIVVNGNAQDAIGDTMNDGSIIIHGSCGDTTGYGMRNGSIYIKGNAGYRIGIHMKEYRDEEMTLVPTIVVGGKVGDFLGEYQAGGTIIVLGLAPGKSPATAADSCPVGGFCATGMHGGRIYIRSEVVPRNLPVQVICEDAGDKDKEYIKGFVQQYVDYFNDGGTLNAGEILSSHFFRLKPNSKSPYKQLYTSNN